MRLAKSKTALCIIMIFLSWRIVYASIDFTIQLNGGLLGPAIDFTDIADTQNQVKEHPESLLNNNDTVIPYGLTLANTVGYPNGKAVIPNFECGMAVGAGVYKYDRYENFSTDDPKIPGGGVNAAFHFGFGLSKDTDLSFKFLINQGMYKPEKNISEESEEDNGGVVINTKKRKYDFTLEETNMVSLGVKGRYNIVPEKKLIPFVLSFGGVTAGVALDYQHARVISKGEYQDTRPVSFTGVNPLSGESFKEVVSVETTIYGNADFEWNVISVTPEIMAYSDLFYFLTLYTGPAVSINAGSANFSMKANGVLVNLSPVYGDAASTLVVATAGNTIATGYLRANEPFSVPLAVPLWKAGFEINIMAFKIQGEAATVLTSPTKSFIAQVGMRVQF